MVKQNIPVYGIDLGTTNSCIAVVSSRNRAPQVLTNSAGVITTPSEIYFESPTAVKVGTEARNMRSVDPANSISAMKRLMSDTKYERELPNTYQPIRPVMAAALVLKKVVSDCNKMLESQRKAPIEQVVITVPAYFGNTERYLTKLAGELIGLNVLALLNEPTAAALSYGMSLPENQTFVVYDLGGGTFDVSLLTVKDHRIEVLATDGDHHLGGIDWDECILKIVLRKQAIRMELNEETRRSGNYFTMLQKADECKKRLSNSAKATFRCNINGKMIVQDITRAEFEAEAGPLVNKTIDFIKSAARMGNISLSDINKIFLVGGSCKMPMITNSIQREFPSTEIVCNHDDLEVMVAKGAAVHGFNMVNGNDTATYLDKDLSSRSYGIKAIDNSLTQQTSRYDVVNIVKRTDEIIVDKFHTVYTAFDRQTSIKIELWENESAADVIPLSNISGRCVSTQSFALPSPAPKNTPVKLHIVRNHDGIIHITIDCMGRSNEFAINPDNENLSDNNVGLMKRFIDEINM